MNKIEKLQIERKDIKYELNILLTTCTILGPGFGPNKYLNENKGSDIEKKVCELLKKRDTVTKKLDELMFNK